MARAAGGRHSGRDRQLLFGLGLQLGAGMLCRTSGGNVRMLAAFAAFCAGAFFGDVDMARHARSAEPRGISLARELDWPAAIAWQFAALAVLWLGLRRYPGGTPQQTMWGA